MVMKLSIAQTRMVADRVRALPDGVLAALGFDAVTEQRAGQRLVQVVRRRKRQVEPEAPVEHQRYGKGEAAAKIVDYLKANGPKQVRAIAIHLYGSYNQTNRNRVEALTARRPDLFRKVKPGVLALVEAATAA